MSRKVIANIVLTLDGRTTGPNGDGDMSVIAQHGTSDDARNMLLDMTTATAAVMGRKNYEGFAGWWPGVADLPTADPRDRAFSAWLNSVPKIVFSNHISEGTWANTTFVNEDPASIIDKLRQEDGAPIRVLSSASIIRQLLAADLIDRLELTLSPEIAGNDAKSLFDEEHTTRSSWAVVSQSHTGSGAILLVLERKETATSKPMGETLIKDIPSRRVLKLRETVPIDRLTDFQGRAFSAIWETLQNAGQVSAEHPYMRCFQESDTEFDVEVGLPVDDDDYEGPASIGSLPGGPALVYTHIGPHSTLGEAYKATSEASTPGHQRDGAAWEVYEWCDFRNSPNPAEWPIPENWRTLLVQPLRAAGEDIA